MRTFVLVYWLVFAVVAVAILVYAATAGGNLSYNDERTYLDIASSLAAGDGYRIDGQPTAYRPPAWPVVLAIPLLAGVPVHLIGLIPALCHIAAGAVASYLGTRIVGNPIGLIAGMAVLLYPLNLYTALTLYPQAFATVLLLSLWLMASRTADCDGVSPSVLTSAVLGLLAAALALSVPTMAFTAACVLGWVCWKAKGNRVRFVLVAGICIAVPLCAWMIRNEAAVGAPTVLSTSSGVNLLLGNNENATPDSGVNVDIDKYVEVASTLGGEVAVDDFYRESGLEWIRANPVDAVELYIGKVGNYFSPYNQPATQGEGGRAAELIAYTTFIAVVLLAILRIALRRRSPVQPSEKLFLFLFVMNAFVMAVFFTRTRFRQPLDSVLLVESAVAVAIVVLALASKHRRQVR